MISTKKRSPPASEANRRLHTRRPILVREARCIAGMDVFFGYALNVSRGGLFVSSSKKRTPGEIFTIQFSLPGNPRTFTCQVEVVWTRSYRHGTHQPPGFGVKFLDLPEEEAEYIDEWIASRQAS